MSKSVFEHRIQGVLNQALNSNQKEQKAARMKLVSGLLQHITAPDKKVELSKANVASAHLIATPGSDDQYHSDNAGSKGVLCTRAPTFFRQREN